MGRFGIRRSNSRLGLGGLFRTRRAVTKRLVEEGVDQPEPVEEEYVPPAAPLTQGGRGAGRTRTYSNAAPPGERGAPQNVDADDDGLTASPGEGPNSDVSVFDAIEDVDQGQGTDATPSWGLPPGERDRHPTESEPDIFETPVQEMRPPGSDRYDNNVPPGEPSAPQNTQEPDIFEPVSDPVAPDPEPTTPSWSLPPGERDRHPTESEPDIFSTPVQEMRPPGSDRYDNNVPPGEPSAPQNTQEPDIFDPEPESPALSASIEIDEETGEPYDQSDPRLGVGSNDQGTVPLDPETGQPIIDSVPTIGVGSKDQGTVPLDPETGQPIIDSAPTVGVGSKDQGTVPLDPETGQPIIDSAPTIGVGSNDQGTVPLDPETGQPIIDRTPTIGVGSESDVVDPAQQQRDAKMVEGLRTADGTAGRPGFFELPFAEAAKVGAYPLQGAWALHDKITGQTSDKHVYDRTRDWVGDRRLPQIALPHQLGAIERYLSHDGKRYPDVSLGQFAAPGGLAHHLPSLNEAANIKMNPVDFVPGMSFMGAGKDGRITGGDWWSVGEMAADVTPLGRPISLLKKGSKAVLPTNMGGGFTWGAAGNLDSVQRIHGSSTNPALLKAADEMTDQLAATGRADVVLGGKTYKINQTRADAAIRDQNPDLVMATHSGQDARFFTDGGPVPDFVNKGPNEQGTFMTPGFQPIPKFTDMSAFGGRAEAGAEGAGIGYRIKTIGKGEAVAAPPATILDDAVNPQGVQVRRPGVESDPLGTKYFEQAHARELELIAGSGTELPAVRRVTGLGDAGMYLDESITAPTYGGRVKANVLGLVDTVRGNPGVVKRASTAEEIAESRFGKSVDDLTPDEAQYVGMSQQSDSALTTAASQGDSTAKGILQDRADLEEAFSMGNAPDFRYSDGRPAIRPQEFGSGGVASAIDTMRDVTRPQDTEFVQRDSGLYVPESTTQRTSFDLPPGERDRLVTEPRIDGDGAPLTQGGRGAGNMYSNDVPPGETGDPRIDGNITPPRESTVIDDTPTVVVPPRVPDVPPGEPVVVPPYVPPEVIETTPPVVPPYVPPEVIETTPPVVPPYVPPEVIETTPPVVPPYVPPEVIETTPPVVPPYVPPEVIETTPPVVPPYVPPEVIETTPPVVPPYVPPEVIETTPPVVPPYVPPEVIETTEPVVPPYVPPEVIEEPVVVPPYVPPVRPDDPDDPRLPGPGETERRVVVDDGREDPSRLRKRRRLPGPEGNAIEGPEPAPRPPDSYPRQVGHRERVEYSYDPASGKYSATVVESSEPVVTGWDENPPDGEARAVGGWDVQPGPDGVVAEKNAGEMEIPPHIRKRLREQAERDGAPVSRSDTLDYSHDLDTRETDRRRYNLSAAKQSRPTAGLPEEGLSEKYRAISDHLKKQPQQLKTSPGGNQRRRSRGSEDKPKGYKMPEIVIVQEQQSSGRRTRGM